MRLILLVASSAVVCVTASAEPKPYRGPHPIDLDGHWHHETSAHVHDDLPVGRAPFADIDGVFVFLGDPRAYGYDGEVWTYRGGHPLPPAMNGDCGIRGDHAHPFAPEGSFRREPSGAYAFTGALLGGRHSYVPGSVMPREPVRTPAAQPAPMVAVLPPCQAFVNAAPGVYVNVGLDGAPCFASGAVTVRSAGRTRTTAAPPAPPPPVAREPEPARAAPNAFVFPRRRR